MKLSPLISNPHHVDFFRYLVGVMEDKGADVLSFMKGDEITASLSRAYRMKFNKYGRSAKKVFPGFATSFRNKISLMKKVEFFGPDLILSVNELPPSPFESILNIPSVVFLNTRLPKKKKKSIFKYADKIVVPDCFHYDVPEKKKITHSSYHSLTYLHPNRFTPDKEVLERLDIGEKDYVLVSFDRKDDQKSSDGKILRRREKIDLVRDLARDHKVFIDGRGFVPPPLREFLPRIPLHKYNDLVSFAELVVSDDPVVSSDAGVLGTPWIYIGDFLPSFLEDQEVHYEIGTGTKDLEEAMELAELVLDKEITPDFEASRKNILKDKIDLTSWMLELVKAYQKGF